MAPKSAIAKRPAAAVLEVPQKRGRKAAQTAQSDPVAAKCALVEEALSRATHLPEQVRQLVAGVVRPSLSVTERHPYQQQAIAFVSEVLAALEVAASEAIAFAQAKVDGADAEKAARQAAQAQAEAVLAEHKVTAAQKEAALSSTMSELKEATRVLKAAKAAEKSGNRDLDIAAARKEELEHLAQRVYQPLKAHTVAGAEAKQCLAALARAAKKFDFEASLMGSLAGVLAKAPEERGTFGQLAVTQFEEVLAAKSAHEEAVLQEGESGRVERAVQVEAAKAASGAATAAKEAAMAELAAAEAAQREAESALGSAQEAVAGFLPELERNCAALDQAKAALQELRAGALAAFAELRDPPPAKVEALVEEAPMQTSASKVPDGAHAPDAGTIAQALSGPAPVPQVDASM